MGRHVYPTKSHARNAYRRAMLDFEREYWTQALKRNGESRVKTALAEGVNRTWLHERLRAVGIALETPKKARSTLSGILASWGRPVSAPSPTNRTAA